MKKVAPPSLNSSAPTEPALFKAFLVLEDDGRTQRCKHSYPTEAHRLLQKYPILPRFAFPAVVGCRDGSLNYTFVLTDEMGRRLYGHTQHSYDADVIVVLSPFPWCHFFSNVMSLYDSVKSSPEEAKRMIAALGSMSLPGPGTPFAAPFCGRWLTRPWDPPGYEFANTNPATLLNVFSDTDDLLTLLSSLLLERHVVVCGPTFQAVTSVMLQCLAMMSPFEWQHIFVPVIPGPELYDVLAAPTPYFVGLIDSQVPALREIEIEDLCFVQLQALGENVATSKIRCTSVSVLAPRADSASFTTVPRSGRTSSLRWSLRALRAVLALHKPDEGVLSTSWIAPWEAASSPALSALTKDGQGCSAQQANNVSFSKPCKRSKSITRRIHGGGAFGLDFDVCGMFLRYYSEWLGPPIAARLSEFRSTNSNGTAATAVAPVKVSDPAEAQFIDMFTASQCFAELADHTAETLMRLEEEATGNQGKPTAAVPVAAAKSGALNQGGAATTPQHQNGSLTDSLNTSMRRASFNNAAAIAAARNGAKLRICPHTNPFLHELLQHHPECFTNASSLVSIMESHCDVRCNDAKKRPKRRGSIRALIARTFSCCATDDGAHSDNDEDCAPVMPPAAGGGRGGAFPTPSNGGRRKMYQVDDA